MTLARRVAPILEIDPQGALRTRYVRGGMEMPYVEAVAGYLVQDGADEIWLRLRGADARGAAGLFEPLKALEKRVFVPVVAWGAVRSPADARLLVGLGAERVVVDCLDEAVEDPIGFVEIIARAIGPDRVTAALVTRRVVSQGRVAWELCRPDGASTGQDAVATAVTLASVGAGEIAIQPHYSGIAALEAGVVHDADLVDTLLSALAVQVISVGEDREPADMVTPLLMGADGVASARLFADGSVSVVDAKAALAEYGIPLRPPYPPYTAPR